MHKIYWEEKYGNTSRVLDTDFLPKVQPSSPKVQPAGLNDRWRGDNRFVLRLCCLGFYPPRSYKGEQAQHRQLMTEPQPTLAGYREVLVL